MTDRKLSAARRAAWARDIAGFSSVLPLHTGPASDFRDALRTDALDAEGEIIGGILGLDYSPSDAGPALADLCVDLVNTLPDVLSDLDAADGEIAAHISYLRAVQGAGLRALGVDPDGPVDTIEVSKFIANLLNSLQGDIAAADITIQRQADEIATHEAGRAMLMKTHDMLADEWEATVKRQADEIAGLRAFGEKVNAIRGSIIGTQTVNWSEHVYPLVAALDAAGFTGTPYPEARENFGTLIERAAKAEAEVARLTAENMRLGEEYDALDRETRNKIESLAHDHAKAVAERDELLRAY